VRAGRGGLGGPDGTPKVHRVVAAVDCGMTVNPDIVRRQIESAVVYGLTAALYGKITFKDGRVEQSNFHDYRMLRMSEMPKVEVHIVQSKEAPVESANQARRRSRPPWRTRSSRPPASASASCPCWVRRFADSSTRVRTWRG